MQDDSNSAPEPPKPVVISIDSAGDVTAFVDGEPVDVNDLLAQLTAAANDAKD